MFRRCRTDRRLKTDSLQFKVEDWSRFVHCHKISSCIFNPNIISPSFRLLATKLIYTLANGTALAVRNRKPTTAARGMAFSSTAKFQAGFALTTGTNIKLPCISFFVFRTVVVANQLCFYKNYECKNIFINLKIIYEIYNYYFHNYK